MKKIILTGVILLTLTGCATNRQNGEVLGAITGAAAGKTLAGNGGAIVGAAIGAAAGGSMGQSLDQQEKGQVINVVPSEISYTVPPPIVYIRPWYNAPGPYWRWSYHSRYGWGYFHPHTYHFHFHHRHHPRHFRH